MKTPRLPAAFLAALLLAPSGRARAASASEAAQACPGGECPVSALDWVFYRYGTDCAGLDWRFLRAAAKAQSGLDSKKADGKSVGLFQLDPEACASNLGPFSGFLNCADRTDPEANTAAAVNRLNRLLTGRRDLGDAGDSPAILETCPGDSAADAAALSFLEQAAGADVLRRVLAQKACKDPDTQKAVDSFSPKDREARLEKYQEARKLASEFGSSPVPYIPGAGKTASCPALTGKRVFKPEELAKASADKPVVDPELLARLSEGSARGQAASGAVQRRLARLDPGWDNPGDPGAVPAAGPGGAAGPTLRPSQLPQGFRTTSPEPPPAPGAAALPSVLYHEVEGKPVEYKLTGPKPQKGFNFRGTQADALVWTAFYEDGAQFTIIAPKKADPKNVYHTVQQAADAASYLPKASRGMVKTVVLNLEKNPDDAYWAKKYKRPGFASYMTAGADGIVTVYPYKKGQTLPTDGQMRSAMLHETGHTWSYNTWGTATAKNGWIRWKKAMDGDKAWVSEYAKSAITEDVAETVEAYGSTKGGAGFADFQKQVPRRFGVLAKEMR